MVEFEDDLIAEPPLTFFEIEDILRSIGVSRNDRREFLYLLRQAKLIVFRDEPC